MKNLIVYIALIVISLSAQAQQHYPYHSQPRPNNYGSVRPQKQYQRQNNWNNNSTWRSNNYFRNAPYRPHPFRTSSCYQQALPMNDYVVNAQGQRFERIWYFDQYGNPQYYLR